MFFSNFEKVSRLAQTLYHPCEGITIPNKLRVLPNWILIQQNGGWRPAYFQFEIHPNLPTNRTPQQKRTSKKTQENMVPWKLYIFFPLQRGDFLVPPWFFFRVQKNTSFFFPLLSLTVGRLSFVVFPPRLSWLLRQQRPPWLFVESPHSSSFLGPKLKWTEPFFDQRAPPFSMIIDLYRYIFFLFLKKVDDVSQDSSNIGTSNQAKLETKPPFKLQAKNALASAMSFQLTTFYGLGRLPSVHVTLLVAASQPLPAWVG